EATVASLSAGFKKNFCRRAAVKRGERNLLPHDSVHDTLINRTAAQLLLQRRRVFDKVHELTERLACRVLLVGADYYLLFPAKKNTSQSASHNELRFSVLSRGGQPYRLRGPLAVSALRKGNLHVKLLPLVQLQAERGEQVHRFRPS